MIRIRWISAHPGLSSFIGGAILSTVFCFVSLEVYGLFFLPAWIQYVAAPGGFIGTLFYNHLLKSSDTAVYLGIVTNGVFYGFLSAGLRRLFAQRHAIIIDVKRRWQFP
jgi:hypothetical protein